MRQSQEGVKINILGKDYTVACPDEKREDLIAAASFLDKSMRDIQKGGAGLGSERVAVMAALNIAHDLLMLRKQGSVTDEVEKRVRALRHKIETSLDKQTEIEL